MWNGGNSRICISKKEQSVEVHWTGSLCQAEEGQDILYFECQVMKMTGYFLI